MSVVSNNNFEVNFPQFRENNKFKSDEKFPEFSEVAKKFLEEVPYICGKGVAYVCENNQGDEPKASSYEPRALGWHYDGNHWNENTAEPFINCIHDYRKYEELPRFAGAVKRTIFKIKEFIKSLFGTSQWQQAKVRLATFMMLLHRSKNPEERPLAGIQDRVYKFDNLAENILRYHTGYGPAEWIEPKNLITCVQEFSVPYPGAPQQPNRRNHCKDEYENGSRSLKIVEKTYPDKDREVFTGNANIVCAIALKSYFIFTERL